jgi:hypothetical protein
MAANEGEGFVRSHSIQTELDAQKRIESMPTQFDQEFNKPASAGGCLST